MEGSGGMWWREGGGCDGGGRDPNNKAAITKESLTGNMI